MGAFKDLCTQRFGRLIVIGREGVDKSKLIMWRCQCDCGRTCLQRGSDLRKLKVKSCGCSGKGEFRDLSG